jgi:glyoxylase-like metal-dependent hydrolase (beta-lactamase superfamily II)
MELPPGVHDLALTFDYGETAMTIHPAAVETHRGLVLIDVGLPGAVEKIEAALSETDHDDVWAVLLTHHDGDHAAGLREVLERVDATVLAHREEAPFVRGGRDPLKGDGDRYPPAPVDVELVGGVTLPTDAGPMTVVETPGHAPGHVSLHFPDEGLLLAGDALVADGEEPLSGPKPEFTPDTETAIASVGRLAELAFDRVLCYHGGAAAVGADRVREIHASLAGE